MAATVFETNFPELKLLARGKVRDTYELPDGSLLMVASDRLSAFDVVFPEGIGKKGQVLTQVSLFWFEKLKGIGYSYDKEATLQSKELTASHTHWHVSGLIFVKD